MLVPKLFRWLFFRKKLVQNTFDALRNDDTIYVDVSIHLGGNKESFANSVQLNHKNLQEFIQKYDKEQIIVLFGNNRKQLNEMHNQLENSGFNQIYNVGTLEELNKIKTQL